METLDELIARRYNAHRTTLFATNYSLEPERKATRAVAGYHSTDDAKNTVRDAERCASAWASASTASTCEMCTFVELQGHAGPPAHAARAGAAGTTPTRRSAPAADPPRGPHDRRHRRPRHRALGRQGRGAGLGARRSSWPPVATSSRACAPSTAGRARSTTSPRPCSSSRRAPPSEALSGWWRSTHTRSPRCCDSTWPEGTCPTSSGSGPTSGPRPDTSLVPRVPLDSRGQLGACFCSL